MKTINLGGKLRNQILDRMEKLRESLPTYRLSLKDINFASLPDDQLLDMFEALITMDFSVSLGNPVDIYR